jgi:putative addiction module component (TIGR02574 family)
MIDRQMSVDPNELLALPTAEKLRLVEMLWDNLGAESDPIPLPQWVIEESVHRREEMRANPELGLSHEETWSRIYRRHG